jgi:hypothetical protein
MNAGQSAMQAAQRVLEQTVRTMDDIAEIRDMLDSDPTAGTESYTTEPVDDPFLSDTDF